MQLPPGFDKAIALEAADLVNLAYDQYEHFLHGQPWALPNSYNSLAILNAKPEGILARKEPFGFVARNIASGNVFVTFRGTKSPADWAADFSFPQDPHPWGKVEHGFLGIYKQCSADVQAAVAGASKVFVTGHSLGAALAVLATADLAASKATMYSFAGPRVGNPAFAASFNLNAPNAWRIVNTEDVVTTVPLATPNVAMPMLPHTPLDIVLMLAHGLDYEHVGVPVCFTTHKGSIAANHDMLGYIDAVKAS